MFQNLGAETEMVHSFYRKREEYQLWKKNKLLINEAKKKLAIRGSNVEIYEIDFFRISNELIYKIAEFQPEIIVGWFIGSNGKDI